MSTQYVVITGASKGIGRATALHLVKMGFHVLAGVRRAEDGAALRREAGEHLTPLLIDVTDPALISRAAEQVSQITGEAGLAGLVNNAGIAVAMPLEFIPIDELRNQLEVNVIGQIAVTQAFVPLLRQAQGRIINISSMAGVVVSPFNAPYHASKFALEALTDALRMELQPWNIDVVSIQPGRTATPIWETSIAHARRNMAQAPPEMLALYGGQIEKRLEEAHKKAKHCIPPQRVAQIIGMALTIKRPKTRYLVGTDAKIAGKVIARLPDRLRDRVIMSQG